MKKQTMTTKMISLLLAGSILLTSCVSTTVIQSNPSGAKIYVDGQSVGTTPYTHSDTKIVGSTTMVKLEKEGYETSNITFSRSEQADVGAIIGGLLVWIPFLWTMKYYPTHNFELTPISGTRQSTRPTNDRPSPDQPDKEWDSDNWKVLGSGLIITKDGYIVTNNHVIKEVTTTIEVEFRHREDIRTYNAKLVRTDIRNDLAIIQIDDEDFQNLTSIPYNFQTVNADVGTEVYALGYPLVMGGMGKDIKFTDGRISAKTGINGDITRYQTTLPLHVGNSGGPMFDHKANLIGINSQRLPTIDENNDLSFADNVSYAVKTGYLMNLIDALPRKIQIPSDKQIASQPLTEQVKILSDYVVLIKVK